MTRHIARILLLLAGLAILALLFYRLGPSNVFSLLRQLGFRFFGVVLIFGVQEFVRALALRQCLPLESRLSLRKIIHIRLIAEAVRAVTLTGPLFSEPARAWFIRRQGVRSSEAVAATVAEYAANSFVAAFLSVAAVIYLINCLDTPKPLRVAALVLGYGSAGYLVIAFSVLYGRIHLASGVGKGLARLFGWGSRSTGRLEKIRQTEDAIHSVFADRPVVLIQLTGLECLSHLLLILETYWALISMDTTVSISTAALAEILSKLANVAFVGATEGVYAFLFRALGFSAAVGFTLSLVKRLRSLAFAAIGLGSFSLMPGRSNENA